MTKKVIIMDEDFSYVPTIQTLKDEDDCDRQQLL